MVVAAVAMWSIVSTNAALSPQHRDRLAAALDELVDGWDSHAVDRANSVLLDSRYSEADWVGFFSWYFQDRPLTRRLWNYLAYPVFYWAPERVLPRLQGALDTVGRRLLEEGLADSRFLVRLESEPGFRETLFSLVTFHDLLPRIGRLTRSRERRVFKAYRSWIKNDFPEFLRADASLEGYAPALRTAVWATIWDLQPNKAGKIARILRLDKARRRILTRHGALMLDNGGSSPVQLGIIERLLAVIPDSLQTPRSISIRDFHPQWMDPQREFGVNIFGFTPGIYLEDSYPADFPGSCGLVDVFSLVLAHEVNHIVDFATVSMDPALRTRRDALIDRAGRKKKEYLRSNVLDGTSNDFFLNAPQEFIASISNQWFHSSACTLNLALSRFDSGFSEPLNQFLFFVDLYREGSSTSFYELSAVGDLEHSRVPVKVEAGRVVGLSWDGVDYEFDLDAAGFVTAYHTRKVRRQGSNRLDSWSTASSETSRPRPSTKTSSPLSPSAKGTRCDPSFFPLRWTRSLKAPNRAAYD
jgi:hypothetical protein